GKPAYIEKLNIGRMNLVIMSIERMREAPKKHRRAKFDNFAMPLSSLSNTDFFLSTKANVMAKRATSKRVSRQWVLDQAEVMLTAFEDVGVSKFDLTLATETRQAAEFVPGITIAKLRRALPSLFDRNEREFFNFIIRQRFGRDY